MISEKEFDRDAAMLAGMVGGHLKHVDSITSDRSQPANRIDIEQFIAPLRGGPQPTANLFDPANRGYIPEQVVQTMQPDVSVSLIEPSTVTSPVNTVTLNTPAVNNPRIVTPSFMPAPSPPPSSYTELQEDIKSIKSTLLKIDSTFTKISGMLGKVFNFITEKEKIKQKE